MIALSRALVLTVSIALGACISVSESGDTMPDPGDSTLTLTNGSSFAIYQLFVSPSTDRAWGPDQLGADVLLPGESVTLTGVTCNSWDIRLVDEDGDECIMEDVSLCFDDAEWQVTDEDLLVCAMFAS